MCHFVAHDNVHSTKKNRASEHSTARHATVAHERFSRVHGKQWPQAFGEVKPVPDLTSLSACAVPSALHRDSAQ